MLPSLAQPSFNAPAMYPPSSSVNSLAAYTQAGSLGVAMLPPPQVLAPKTMNIQPSYPAVATSPQPTYVPWPYPMPSYYPAFMPPAYNNMPQQPYPATQPLPAPTDNKTPAPAADTMNVPEVLSLSQIAHGLEDKGSMMNQEIAAENLGKLIRENPDFQKLKIGAPEAIVLKALHSPEPQVRLKTLVALADDKVLSVTPKVRTLLKRAKSSGNTTAVEQGFVDLILNKNGRTVPNYGSPSYAGAADSTTPAGLPPMPDNIANLLKQGGKV